MGASRIARTHVRDDSGDRAAVSYPACCLFRCFHLLRRLAAASHASGRQAWPRASTAQIVRASLFATAATAKL